MKLVSFIALLIFRLLLIIISGNTRTLGRKITSKSRQPLNKPTALKWNCTVYSGQGIARVPKLVLTDEIKKKKILILACFDDFLPAKQ